MTGTELHHFYHVYADSEWREPVEEHLQALQASGLGAERGFSLNVGLVGDERNCAAVRDFLNDHALQWKEIARSSKGWEQVTLNALAHARQTSEGFVFYAHTKGASAPSSFNTAWRRRMTYFTVTHWREAVSSLETHHAYGCHWMQMGGFWFFGGPGCVICDCCPLRECTRAGPRRDGSVCSRATSTVSPPVIPRDRSPEKSVRRTKRGVVRPGRRRLRR